MYILTSSYGVKSKLKSEYINLSLLQNVRKEEDFDLREPGM